jgi:hypothetical protein
MRGALCTLATIAFCCLADCNNSKPTPAPATTAAAPDAVRITQFYATQPRLPRGEKELLCYGVENAKTVWLAPPRQELSAALSRCVEVNPTATTTYTLTAEGTGGPAATKDVTVTLGGERVKIVDVTVSALSVKAGDTVSICVHSKGAASVEVEPLHFRTANRTESCTLDHPKQTTTYAVTATGADGDQDHERVTVKVQ